MSRSCLLILALLLAVLPVDGQATDGATSNARGRVVTFYVAPDGNDSWSGTLRAPNARHTNGPFATFDHARTVVQSLNKAGVKQVVVQFRDGTYFLPETVQFTAADSGTPGTEIVYQNYRGESPVISGGGPSPHRLQGIGAGFVPHNLHRETLDGVITVSEEDAFAYAVRVAREEGIFVGPSSGAALAAVAQKLPEIPDASVVLTFSYDTGERYFSVEGLFDADGASVRAADDSSRQVARAAVS